MKLRSAVKRWVYGGRFGRSGVFPYFGTRVHFPNGSGVFELACEEGVFENDNIILLSKLMKPDGWYFDIGANIGMMAVPLLHACPNLQVVSFEPSSNVLPHLRRTIHESKYADRWSLVEKAVGSSTGRMKFYLSRKEEAAYDGLRNTGRAPVEREESVEVTTLDVEWERLGRPAVSVIKVDVEGAEIEALRGGEACIGECRPHILFEWNMRNLLAYNFARELILKFAMKMGYECFATPLLIGIRTPKELEMQMLRTESFLLAPAPKSD